MSAAKNNAVRYDIDLERGIGRVIRLGLSKEGEPFNFAGWTGLMQVRENARADEVIIELSTDNGGITFDNAKGEVTLKFKPQDTIKLSMQAETDLLLISPDDVPFRVLYGTVTPVWVISRHA